MRMILATMLILIPSAASADRGAADRCAKKLPADARTIYNAAIPGLAKAPDRTAHITSRAISVVLSGAVPMATARQSGEAAGSCLRLL